MRAGCAHVKRFRFCHTSKRHQWFCVLCGGAWCYHDWRPSGCGRSLVCVKCGECDFDAGPNGRRPRAFTRDEDHPLEWLP